MHKKVAMLLTSCSAAIMTALMSAHAADMRLPVKAPPAYEPPPYNWTGFSIFGFGSFSANFGEEKTSILGGIATIDLERTPRGAGGGGGLEWLYQAPAQPWVVGVRASAHWVDMKGTGSLTVIGVPVVEITNKTNFLGDANLVAGYSGWDPRVLTYVTGGFAFGQANPSVVLFPNTNFCSVNATFCPANDSTKTGWNIGTGIRYAVTPNVSLFTESDYTNLGSVTIASRTIGLGGGGPPIFGTTAKFNIFETKGGVSWRFGAYGG